MNRAWAWAPLAALVLLVAAAGLVLIGGGERETVTDGRIGRALSAYALTPLDPGPELTPEAFAGRAYVINVFASWCGPCRAEHPHLMAMQANGVEILGVAYKDRPGAAARFLNELGDPFSAVALDPQGRFGLELGMAGVPETFVVGADGAIRAVHRGPLTAEIVAEEIMPALAAN